MNWDRYQRKADQLIGKYGAKAILRRDTGDRYCTAVMMDYDPKEDQGVRADLITRIYMISALGLDPPPIMGKDVLVILDPATGAEVEKLRIVEPPFKLAPGVTPVYWELRVKA